MGTLNDLYDKELDKEFDRDLDLPERDRDKDQENRKIPSLEELKKLDQNFIKDDLQYNLLLASLQDSAKAILGRNIVIETAAEGHVAYTFEGDKDTVTIGISRFNEFYKGATAEEGKALRLGLLCHEVMHQIMTPFADIKRREDQMDKSTAGTFHFIHNVMEDPAIEHFCPQFIGGKMKTSLKYTIAWGYDQSQPIDKSPSAWAQYCNALIQYGDMGPIKGKFTFPEAKEMFQKTIKLFSQGMREPRGKERVKIAARLTEITRPLWEKDENAQKQMQEMLKKRGDSKSTDGQPQHKHIDPKDNQKGQPTDKQTDGQNGGQIEITDEIKDQLRKMTEETLDHSDMEIDKVDKKKIEQSNNNKDNRTIFDTSEKTKELMDKIRAEIKGEKIKEVADALDKKIEKNKPKAYDNHKETNKEKMPEKLTTIPDIDRYKCHNEIAKEGTERDYDLLLQELTPEIDKLTKTLEEIFKTDEDEYKIYKTSGKLDIKRYSSPKVTARTFSKHRDPGDKRDMCISLCIDHSGSMTSDNRIAQAGKAAVVIAEACAKLDIPCYIMGYEADYNDADQRHYVRWNNSKEERRRLSNIQYSANGCNFDAYSIKYMADEILKKREETHKILMVISDGLPSNGFTNDPEKDTKEVIENTREEMDVVGIGINKSENENFEKMYGDGYCDGTNIKELPKTLAKLMENIVKNWD